MRVLKCAVAASLALIAVMVGIAQQSQPSLYESLRAFDQEHDVAEKEYRLGEELVKRYPRSGSALLKLAETTLHVDTRWMSMRGMRELHYLGCERFLKNSLKDSNAVVRANAARVLGDLGFKDAEQNLLNMFAAESDPGAVEQASLALRMLEAKRAVPYIREKIPNYTWQTRGWLLQALGSLGDKSDVPLLAGYLDNSDKATAQDAPLALWTAQNRPREFTHI